MANTVKKVFLENIGEVTLKKFRTSKRISLKMKQNGEVLVTMPLSVSYAEGINFALEQKDWVKQIQSNVNALKESKFITNKQNNHTPLFEINFVCKATPKLSANFNGSEVRIIFPEGILVEDDRVQKFVKKVIAKILRKKAETLLPPLINQLAKQHNFKYGTLKLNSAKTRWGSCTSKGNINLSVYLLLLPQHLIEYVILHELCHTKVMNHGPAFYHLMDNVTGNNTLLLKKELKMESLKWAHLKN